MAIVLSCRRTLHLVPDDVYNKAHNLKYYVAFCKSKDILDSAFLRLRLQNVTVHKSVNRQTIKGLNPTLQKLHGAETTHSPG